MTTALVSVGLCVLLVASLVATSKDKQSTHRYMAAIGFLLAYVLLYSAAAQSGLIAKVPSIAGSDVAAMFAIAACSYAGFGSMIRGGSQKPKAWPALLYVGSAAALVALAYNAIAAPALAARLGRAPGHFDAPIRRLITLSADLAMIAAFVALIAEAASARAAGTFRGGFRYRLAAFACYLAGVLVTAASDVFASERIRLAGYLLSGANSVLFSFAHISVNYRRREKPVSGSPNGAALELSRRLSELMGSKKPYRDPNLSLKDLARMLGEDPLALSNHLNKVESTSFPAFVNGWRLKAVCQGLAESPGRSILDIALDSGFNSKSNFNALFQKAYGTTPREYRKGLSLRLSKAEGRAYTR